jgi:hypothetical protein
MNEHLLHLITQIAEVCLIPLFGYLTSLLISKINAKLEADKKKTEAEIAEHYLLQFNDIIVACIRATNQTYVEELKKAGNFDKAAQEAALAKTLEAVKATLNDESKKYIEMFTADIEVYILN